MNVVVCSASRKVALVQAFQRALAARGGGRVIAIDASPLAAALFAADERELSPRLDDATFLPAMLELCRRRDVRLLIPTRDEELPFFARHRCDFAAIGTLVPVAAPDVIETCQDKQRFLAFCRQGGFETACSYADCGRRAALPFPLFARPRRGKGGRGARRIDDRGQLEQALREQPDAIVQEFVDAPEFTLDICSDFEGRVLSVVPRLREQVLGGESFVSRTRKDERLLRAGQTLAEKLGLVGHSTVQCFLRAGRVLFIEVNPRFGGAANLGFAAGAATPEMLVRLAEGERVEPCIGEFQDGLVMLRYTQDVFVDAATLQCFERTGRISGGLPRVSAEIAAPV